MNTVEQLQLLNEVDSVIIPRDVYLDYKRLQSLEKKLKPLTLDDMVSDEVYNLRCYLLTAHNFDLVSEGWIISRYPVKFSNEFLKTATHEQFMEKFDKEI